MGNMRETASVLSLIVALSCIQSAQPKWDDGEGEQPMKTFDRSLEPMDSQRRDSPRGDQAAPRERRWEEETAYRGRRERASEEYPMEDQPQRRSSTALPEKPWTSEDPVSSRAFQEPENLADGEKVQRSSLPRKIWNDFSSAAGDAYDGIRTGWRSMVPRFSRGTALREEGAANRTLRSDVRSDAAVVAGQVLSNNAPAAGGFAETRADALRGDGGSKTESADNAMSSLIPGSDGQLFGYSIWLWIAIAGGIAFCYLLCFIFKKQIPTLIRYIEICLCEYLIVALWQPFRFLFWMFKKCFYPTKEIVMLSYKKCDYYYHPYKIVCKG